MTEEQASSLLTQLTTLQQTLDTWQAAQLDAARWALVILATIVFFQALELRK